MFNCTINSVLWCNKYKYNVYQTTKSKCNIWGNVGKSCKYTRLFVNIQWYLYLGTVAR